VLGEYKSVLINIPKTKNELVKVINGLGSVDMLVFDLIDGKNVGKVKGEIDRFIGSGKKNVSVVLFREK
tara:strand:+ start:876 stop:1082 length:207 start_codon:yes stop_codon:yes gene_type:complete